MKEYIRLVQLTSSMNFIIYYKDSNHTIRHRENDKPAVIWNSGRMAYYKKAIPYKRNYSIAPKYKSKWFTLE